MTENEAKEILATHYEFLRESWKPYPDIKVLDAIRVAISSIDKIQQYRAIGTVEECREARERQRGKKPVYPYLKSFPTCPNCGEVNLQQENEYGNVVANYDFCPDCGQAISRESDTL